MVLQAVFESRLKDTAMAVPLMCCAADMLSVPSRKQVVLVGPKPSTEMEDMLVVANASYEPNRTVSISPGLTNSALHSLQLIHKFACLLCFSLCHL